eukprot:CAMPEP_0194400332 /NCGR_PEP_ID=MMETSP0174-20130528/127152_1 /TAXON_ID=216777 /ORGANISM="Proboscia alata, Strain PI-D3" /LENGTH=1298 /DNA_ID=CAMNT_0039196831 /DNA_START=207 /DNA_END=4102 /DNA_ORIENTATION=-
MIWGRQKLPQRRYRRVRKGWMETMPRMISLIAVVALYLGTITVSQAATLDSTATTITTENDEKVLPIENTCIDGSSDRSSSSCKGYTSNSNNKHNSNGSAIDISSMKDLQDLLGFIRGGEIPPSAKSLYELLNSDTKTTLKQRRRGRRRNSKQKGKRRKRVKKQRSSSSIPLEIIDDDDEEDEPPFLSSKSIPTSMRYVSTTITGYGKAIGIRDRGVDIWRSIPYAAPPVGSLRFAAPEPPQPWSPSKLDATNPSSDCWQRADPTLNPGAEESNMSEDCLYLNVFTPAGHADRTRQGIFLSGSKKRLPVMVWIHGGAFQQGGSNRAEYDGRQLAERGIIVVTINYRLGALGFLVSASDRLHGNYGLMDQRAAIHWVHDQIRNFGGDDENITLFGESAGAVTVGLHLMMEGGQDNEDEIANVTPQATVSTNGKKQKNQSQESPAPKRKRKRLIHRAIMQSNPLGYTFRSVIVADFIGASLKRAIDCQNLSCLRSESVDEIMRAQASLMGIQHIPRSVGDFFTWGPTLTKNRYEIFGGGNGEVGGGGGGGGAIFEQLYLSTSSSASSSFLSSMRRSSSSSSVTNPSSAYSSYVSDFRSRSDEFKKNLLTSKEKSTSWSSSVVHVSQPLLDFKRIPNDIPIMIGTNKHEGEMFVYPIFPSPMPKTVYWMFVGALFRGSSKQILKHYRTMVAEVEKEADELARKQIEEEEARQEYIENWEQLEKRYEKLSAMNATRLKEQRATDGLRTFVNSWSPGLGGGDNNNVNKHGDRSSALLDKIERGGGIVFENVEEEGKTNKELLSSFLTSKIEDDFWKLTQQPETNITSPPKFTVTENKRLLEVRQALSKRAADRLEQNILRRKRRKKNAALKKAAHVVVDYRPVMSKIIDDYLFRCPSWRLAQLMSESRDSSSQRDGSSNDNDESNKKGDFASNVFVYRFSQPTHIPGYKECWGKACHTAELPYVFQSMEIIRTNYSAIGPFAEAEAPTAPEYPYTELLDAYRGAFGAAEREENPDQNQNSSSLDDDNYSKILGGDGTFIHPNQAFQSILKHFFGDYFTVDADEELASDMADRWTSFARSGNPNYDGSSTEWLPWWYRNSTSEIMAPDYSLDDDDYFNTEEVFEEETDFYAGSDSDEDIEYFDEVDDNKQIEQQRIQMKKLFRSKTLDALSLDVAEEDLFRTELKRVKKRKGSGIMEDGSSSYHPKHIFRMAFPHIYTNEKVDERLRESSKSYSTVGQIIQAAKEMGLMGQGISSSSPASDVSNNNSIRPEILPEILELSWPPEGRLIERDCTCEMWDRIRYQY